MKKLATMLMLALLSCATPKAPPKSNAETTTNTPAPRPTVTDEHPSFDALGSRLILAAAMKYPRSRRVAEPPLSLTASDGTGLKLVSLDARAMVEGPLAFTELRLRFDNPRPRVIEGRFHIALPPRAAISRLAMRIDDRWQEAEVVERSKARRAYEDFLHRKQDPALLERKAGNAFRARIFPIPARGSKDIIISYSHELEAGDRYRLPLRGLPEVTDLAVSLRVRSAKGKLETFRFDEQHYKPQRDFLHAAAAIPKGIERDGLVVARLAPKLDAQPETLRRMAILFDTSASRALGFKREVKRLGHLLEQLQQLHGGELVVALATFDQVVTPIFDGPIAQLGSDQLRAVLARRPLGASNIGAAIDWLARVGQRDRAVLISDGVATAGGDHSSSRAALKRLKANIGRLDVVARGGIRDEAAMRSLAVGALARDGVVLDGTLEPALLAKRLSQTTRSGVTVEVAGAQWVWPSRLDGVQPGDRTLVFARLANAAAPRTLAVTLGGSHAERIAVPLAQAAGPLLARAAAGATIARLEAERVELGRDRASERQRLRSEIIGLSTKHRVLSAHTALLVLETEADYQRFAIDRRALADILTVGSGGIAVAKRTIPAKVSHRKARRPALDTELQPATDGSAPAASAPVDDCVNCFKRSPLPPTSQAPRSAAGGDDSYGYEFADDPLTAGGFGPNDAVIRVRPGPQRRNAYRPPTRFPISNPLGDDDVDADGRASNAYSGRMAEVMRLLVDREPERAVVAALRWRNKEPGDVMALVALGEALEARGNLGLAARAYGSVIDLFPSRADMRRFAAGRLDRLQTTGNALAVNAYRKAVEQRPDHLTGHRLLAYALLRSGQPEQAFAALEQAFRRYPEGRFQSGLQVLREDLGIIAAAWLPTAADRRAEIIGRLGARSAKLAEGPSLRFVLSWETDANDVDLHVFDASGDHAFFERPRLQSGGRLYADVTNGFGPECFAIAGPARSYPYELAVHYYARGPMGYGMGKVEVIDHDGNGGVRFQQLPFVVMNDRAFVKLGRVTH